MPGWACNNTNRTIKQMKLSQHKIHLMRSIKTWWRNAILIMVFMRKQGNGCRSAVMGLPWLWGCNKVTSRTVMGFHAVLGINKATNVAKFQSGVHVKKKKNKATVVALQWCVYPHFELTRRPCRNKQGDRVAIYKATVSRSSGRMNFNWHIVYNHKQFYKDEAGLHASFTKRGGN